MFVYCSQLPGTTLPSTMDTTASVLDVDSSDDMVMKLVEELRKMISDLEDDNRLLRTKLVQEKLNNLTKIGTLQDKVKGQSVLDGLDLIASLVYLFSLQRCSKL